MTDFTTQARALVAANDRRAWRRALLRRLRRARGVAVIGWSALALVGLVVYTFPPYGQWVR
jgi:hypothetical protein